LWFIKQFKTVESDIGGLTATSSTVDGSPARKSEKMSDFLVYSFTYELKNKEEHRQCVVCGEILTNNSFNARNLCRHLKRKHKFLANKLLQFLKENY
jgi:hypothetical protein